MWTKADRVWMPFPPQPPATLLGPAWDTWVETGRIQWERYLAATKQADAEAGDDASDAE